MSAGAWLHSKHNDLIPPEEELQAVRKALDQVEHCLDETGGRWCIAERHPCGSYEKKTMLPGRKEADLVVVLREAPGEQTLEELRALLAERTSAQEARVLGKAVALRFPEGVKVDVLPVAKPGVTEPSPDVPPKLRHALSGPQHVAWFRETAHNTPIHAVVRLLKALRDVYPALAPLRSFAIEVLAVTLLRSFEGDLADHFTRVVSALADAWLDGRVLPDPADPSNDLLSGVAKDQRASITAKARDIRRSVESGTWSAVFAQVSAALPSSNLGGRTLA